MRRCYKGRKTESRDPREDVSSFLHVSRGAPSELILRSRDLRLRHTGSLQPCARPIARLESTCLATYGQTSKCVPTNYLRLSLDLSCTLASAWSEYWGVMDLSGNLSSGGSPRVNSEL